MRGLLSSGIANLESKVHVLLEHSNRGKKSLALDLNSKDGLDLLAQAGEVGGEDGRSNERTCHWKNIAGRSA